MPSSNSQKVLTLVLDRKSRIFLPLVSILAAASVGFSAFSFLIRGFNKDVLVFGVGALLLFAAIVVLRVTGRTGVASLISLIPVSLLLPLAVFFPLPTSPNVTALFTLAAGGAMAMVLGVLLGPRPFHIVIPGAISFAATILFFAGVLVPAFPLGADPKWARSDFIASLLIEGIVLSALLYVYGLIDAAMMEVDAINRGLKAQVLDRNAELETLNAELRSTLSRLAASQSNLVLTARLSLLAELVAGIHHEVNTPLAAISSSTRTLIEERTRVLSGLPALVASLDPARRSDLRDILAEANANPLRSGLELRQARQLAESRLADLGIPEIDDAANILAQLGLEAVDDRAAAILKTNPEALRIMYGVGISSNALAIVEKAAGRIAAVVEALAQYGDFRLADAISVVPLAKSVEAALPLVRHDLQRGVKLRCEYDWDLAVMGHPGRLAQVWRGLIMNAMQAMEWKGTIAISIRREGPHALVSVADDGPGIPEALRPRIFEAFFTTKEEQGGMGLGLAIVKQIVEEQGGEVSFTSGSGSTVFTVRLPALDLPGADD
ncbi:MAG: HAMP domain-containing sensor histidine kinase [Treponema sp.]|nr:HAMP domain-containing sensor histidine kinase [Treponema sp.]